MSAVSLKKYIDGILAPVLSSIQQFLATAVTSGNGVHINSGTVSIDNQATIEVSGTTATVTPLSGTSSVVLHGNAAGGPVQINVGVPAFTGQRMRLQLHNSSTAATVWSLGSSIVTPPSMTYVPTATPGQSDWMEIINQGTASWVVAALLQGVTI